MGSLHTRGGASSIIGMVRSEALRRSGGFCGVLRVALCKTVVATTASLMAPAGTSETIAATDSPSHVLVPRATLAVEIDTWRKFSPVDWSSLSSTNDKTPGRCDSL
ncbi:MAG: hypothetical protein AAF958_14285 [Planctomycetota bacterium]